MTSIDLAHLRQWQGRQALASDTLYLRQAHLMAATLGQDPIALQAGASLPPLWHWIYFLEGLPPSELGPDGHPARGSFLPPVPLPNRMWAGGDVHFFHDLILGAAIEKRSSIQSIEHKQGRSGDLVFVKVLHQLFQNGQLAVAEAHDIVYKSPSPAADSSVISNMPPAQHHREFEPNATTLFRYSALTFNGHRIHYDSDYCRHVEGYGNLVVHGPLIATLLAGFAQAVAARPLKRFSYQALRPSLLGYPLRLCAGADQDQQIVWAALPDGGVSMRAVAGF